MRQLWHRLSISQKLFTVVGILGLLIATELLTLRFAMTTLSSVRAFVGGEGLWSKAEKAAVLNLREYSITRDPKFYIEFQNDLQVPLGDRQARTEMAKAEPNFRVVLEGFVRGRIHPDDVPGLFALVRKFHAVPYLARALEIWGDGDRLLTELTHTGEELHRQIELGASRAQIQNSINQIESIDHRLTALEDNFSYTLGEGSRWLENLLMGIILLAVLMVEGTGLLLTFSFSRKLSRGLVELAEASAEIGRGNFKLRVPVASRDELGRLAESFNSMAEQLEQNVDVRQQAERANQVKSMFLANMSHEIRTPLAAILGFAELLKDENLSVSDRQRYVEIIHRTGVNLSKIINDILDLSKVEAGRFEIHMHSFSLRDVLNDIYQVMVLRCEAKNIALTFEDKGDVPDWISSDPLRLRQVLMNLLSNAVKFTESGVIELVYQVVDQQLTFTIRDSGIGMAPSHRNRLFQAFSQIDSSSVRKFEGTGLGLVLSRKLARLLGGDVELLESALGEGSTFRAHIPLILAPDSREHADSQKILSLLERRLRGKNILVVEDVLENQLLIETILRKYGVEVSVANNGEEGMRRALEGNFDAVIMDVQMPVMDGYTAVRNLRNLKYEKPVIALTAHAMKEDRVKCLGAGYSDYLAKPIQPEQFLRTLGEHI